MAKYTDAQRAAALAALKANGGNLSATSRDTGIPYSTVKRWRDEPDDRLAELGHEKEDDLSTELRVVANLLARAIPGKIADAPLNQTAVALGIVFDKLQLLEGKPTSIDEVRDGLTDLGDAAREAAATALRRRGLVN